MTPDNLKRKLTAILSADVKGYSRLMGEDEEWTLRTLNSHKEMMGSLIQQHRGRVVGTAGDSILAEFASVVDAVQCAVEIQQVLRAKNAMLPAIRRMEFRIGINLGDVIEEGDSIYGDGVNIAARLEGLAEPGGICISESAFQQIENKIPLQYDYLGEHEVKNIAKPVRVYRARIEPEAISSPILEEKNTERKKLSRAVLVGIALVVIAAAVVLYLFAFRPAAPKMEVASKDKMAFPLPDKPSIAVLPFVNMSGDPKQEFFSDGITEDIITALSKIPKLFVIARNSTFTYKGKPVKVKQVSEDLGVRYVLEGSIQKSENQVRITVQLIDALSGHHLWSERYTHDLKDLFALQDEVTLRILTALQVKLTQEEETLLSRKFLKTKDGLDCYLKVMEGLHYQYMWTIEGNKRQRAIAEEIISRWPENPAGYFLAGLTYWRDQYLDPTKSREDCLKKAMELAQKALAKGGDSYSQTHVLLSAIYISNRDLEKGFAEAKKALDLDPNDAFVVYNYASALHFSGRHDESIPIFQRSIRLNPLGSSNAYNNLGGAYAWTGRSEEAVSARKQAIRLSPDNIHPHLALVSTYIELGREKEARAEAAEVLRIQPNFSVDNYAKASLGGANYLFIARLRKAGLK
jgi:adenylate cyclase